MNRTNFEHLFVGLVIQCLIWLVSGHWYTGALFVTGLFFGREHAQREYLIGNPINLVGYEALDFWRWDLDEVLDLAFPVAGVWLVYLITEYLK